MTYSKEAHLGLRPSGTIPFGVQSSPDETPIDGAWVALRLGIEVAKLTPYDARFLATILADAAQEAEFPAAKPAPPVPVPPPPSARVYPLLGWPKPKDHYHSDGPPEDIDNPLGFYTFKIGDKQGRMSEIIMQINATGDIGSSTGRMRWHVECLTCGEVIHPATTGGASRMEHHLEHHRDEDEAAIRGDWYWQR